ncbi:MAG: hypothetical protein AB7J35_10395 [Dehalococcoidia bacterium]
MADSARLKLQRAQEHLEALQREIQDFDRRSPNTVVVEPNVNGYNFPIRLSLKEAVPLDRWGLLIGDCIHNARSALDHAVWQLTGKTVDAEDTRTQFPIFDDPKKFRDFGRRMIATLDPATQFRPRAIIKWMQPYRRAHPRNAGLWVLHQLDVADKHKVLGIGAVVHNRIEVRVEGVNGTLVHSPAFTFDTLARFEDGAHLGWLHCADVTAPEGMEKEVNVYAHLTVDVVFDEGVPSAYRGSVIIPTLQDLLKGTFQIVALLFDSAMPSQEAPPLSPHV